MKKLFVIVILISLFINSSIPVLSKEKKKENQGIEKTFKVKTNNEKGFNKVEVKDKTENVSNDSEELIPVNVKNEFDEEIKVKFDTNREYPIGPHESISLGKRPPGRYTLTIYNKKGEFVDNLTRSIDKKNKFVLNKDIVSNSNKITGLSTGQKIAIGAGAVGALALGSAIVNMVLNKQEENTPEYIPSQNTVLPQEPVVINVPQAPPPSQNTDYSNAFASGGKPFKFLNKKFNEITLIIEGTDGNPIGSNWIIPKAGGLEKPQPLIINGQKITINPNQKLKTVLPDGGELVRNAFELKNDPFDGSYVWVLE